MEMNDQLEDVQWLQNLQVEMGGTFSWVDDELEDSFSINGERYTIKSLLGEGSFGAVYHCTREAVEGGNSAQDVAVKIISTDRISIITACSKQNVIRRMLHEAELLGCLGGHPHIVQLHCAAISQTSFRIFMVMQLMSCSDLFNELLRRRKPFPENEAGQIVRQLSMAVLHCHRHQIAHRDIKLENIMLASRHPPVLKLIDFGQAQIQGAKCGPSSNQGMNVALSKSVQTAKTLTTSKLYTSPDVKQAIEENETYDAFKLDAFGIGVICYGLLCSSLPEAAKGGLFQKGPKWKALSVNAQDLISRLLHPDPHDRLSVAEVLQHPFVSTTGSASAVSSKLSTPGDFEYELRAFMKSQALLKALQKERGASCWMLDGSQDADMRCKWMCASTNDQFDEAIDAVENLHCEKDPELGKTLRQIRNDIEAIRMVCRKCDEQDGGQSVFDTVFATYCKKIEEVIHLIGRLMVAIQKHDAPVTIAELRIRLLLLVSEQLGRERGFICGHLRRRDLLMSLPVQKRFAKIQGCRQLLLGSTSPESAESGVVSFGTGLLPNLRLADAPLISQADLEVLEAAEAAVLEWKSTASEWFTIITDLIDKVHQQASVAFLGWVQETGRQASANPVLTDRSFSQPEPATPQSQRETMAPSWSANVSEKSMSERAPTNMSIGGSVPPRNDFRRPSASSSGPEGGSLPAHGHHSFPLDSFGGNTRSHQQKTSRGMMAAAALAGFQQAQEIADLHNFAAGPSFGPPGFLPAHGQDGTPLRAHEGYQQQKRSESGLASVGTGFEPPDTFDLNRFAGCSSTPDGMYGESLPLKVITTPMGGPMLATPESTPLHPGLWQGMGLNFPLPASLLPLAGRQNPIQGHPAERMVVQQGHLEGRGEMYIPEALSPPMPINNSQGAREVQGSLPRHRPANDAPPGLLSSRPEAPGMPSRPVNNVPEQQTRKDVLISKGTIGHPISCRGLGCKFASKDRGCKEGEDCLRCHLCVWKRAPEKVGQKRQQGQQSMVQVLQ